MRAIFPVFLLASLAIAPAVGATHGTSACTSSDLALGVLEVGTGDPRATFYVDDRGLLGGDQVWVYQESNGVYGVDLDLDGDVDPHDNLQRASVLLTIEPDPCADEGPWMPDTLIY